MKRVKWRKIREAVSDRPEIYRLVRTKRKVRDSKKWDRLLVSSG